jgi:hypothetical protein
MAHQPHGGELKVCMLLTSANPLRYSPLYISQDLVARDLPLRTQLLAEAKKLPELILTEVITSSLPLVAPFLVAPISSGGKTFLGFDMMFRKRG